MIGPAPICSFIFIGYLVGRTQLAFSWFLLLILLLYLACDRFIVKEDHNIDSGSSHAQRRLVGSEYTSNITFDRINRDRTSSANTLHTTATSPHASNSHTTTVLASNNTTNISSSTTATGIRRSRLTDGVITNSKAAAAAAVAAAATMDLAVVSAAIVTDSLESSAETTSSYYDANNNSSNNTVFAAEHDSNRGLPGLTRQPSSSSSLSHYEWVNAIIDGIWRFTFTPEQIMQMVNDWIKDLNLLSSIMETIKVTKLTMGNAPTIRNIRCIEHSDLRTLLEVDFYYDSDFFVQWTMRPRVVPINMRSSLSKVVAQGKVRVFIEYSEGGVSEISVCFSDYPHLDGNVHIFEALDYSSLSATLPGLTSSIRRKFREFIRLLVYPNKIPLLKLRNANVDTSSPLYPGGAGVGGGINGIGMQMRKDEMDELEDEIKKTLLDIDQLLNSLQLQGENKDAATKEVCRSLVQFLQYSSQPGRVPLSMMASVKRGFELLNRLAFSPSKPGVINPSVVDVLLQPETIGFIGQVCHTCTLADALVLNLMSIRDDDDAGLGLRTQVNSLFNELELQDVPFLVFNRHQQQRRQQQEEEEGMMMMGSSSSSSSRR